MGEDASKQGRNEAKDSGEEIGLSTSAGLGVADMVIDGDMGDVIASGEAMVQEEMDVDSGDNENFVVADIEGHVVVMEVALQEKLVERSDFAAQNDSVADSTAIKMTAEESTAVGVADPTASLSDSAAAGVAEPAASQSAAETMIMMSETTSKAQSQPLPSTITTQNNTTTNH